MEADQSSGAMTPEELDKFLANAMEDQVPKYDFPLGNQLPLDRCPHCAVAKPHMGRLAGPYETKAHDGSNSRHWEIFSCKTCGGVILARSNLGSTGRVTHIYPSPRNPDSAIPSRARHFLSQAMETLNAPSGSIMLAASAVDAMLKAKNYKDGNLYPRIKKAAKENVITDEMEQWAHDVRLDANDQRHADEEAELPTREDAVRCVEFAEALGEFLFVLPARVKRGRKNATGKSNDKD